MDRACHRSFEFQFLAGRVTVRGGVEKLAMKNISELEMRNFIKAGKWGTYGNENEDTDD